MSINGTFNVGNIYKRSNKYYIAIKCRTVLTYYNEQFLEYTAPNDYFTEVDELSVKDLCQAWGISIPKLDNEMKKYFSPDPEALSRARNGQPCNEDTEWEEEEMNVESEFDMLNLANHAKIHSYRPTNTPTIAGNYSS